MLIFATTLKLGNSTDFDAFLPRGLRESLTSAPSEFVALAAEPGNLGGNFNLPPQFFFRLKN